MLFIFVFIVFIVGCVPVTQYDTIKTGNDRYTLTGTDPNQLQGMAYKACKSDGFDDYSVLENYKDHINVRCEKIPPPQPSLMTKVNDKAERAWDYVKHKVDDYNKSISEKSQEKSQEKKEELMK